MRQREAWGKHTAQPGRAQSIMRQVSDTKNGTQNLI